MRKAAALGLLPEDLDLKLPEDVFELPQTGIREMLAISRRLSSPVAFAKLKITTFEEYDQLRQRANLVITTATERVLADPVASMKQSEQAAVMLLNAQLSQLRSEVPDSASTALAIAQRLVNDPRPKIAKIAADKIELLRIHTIPQIDLAAVDTLLEETLNRVKSTNFDLESLKLAAEAGRVLEGMKDSSLAAHFMPRLADLMETSDNEKVQTSAVQVRGIARRLNLPGNAMVLQGTLLDGQPFDLASLSGKVVLVDFWATWCGPCVAEIPRVHKLYDAYHGKGFEVVGVSLDNKIEPLVEFIAKREIPWPNLYPTGEGADKIVGWANPLVKTYGITGIPTCILVGADGKVISIRARGEDLEKALVKLFGPVPEEVEKAHAQKAAAAKEAALKQAEERKAAQKDGKEATNAK